jgi:hypothetical protein
VLRPAAPADYWPLADLHCAVFFPAEARGGWRGGLSRVDRLMALQMNAALERRKAGRRELNARACICARATGTRPPRLVRVDRGRLGPGRPAGAPRGGWGALRHGRG